MNLGFIFFSQSEESTSVLADFLNSISDLVVTDPKNEEFENTAFEILSEIHTYLSSPSWTRKLWTHFHLSCQRLLLGFQAPQRGVSVFRGLMESFIGVTDGDRAVGSQSLILQLNGSCVVVVACRAGQCKVSVEGTKLGVRLLLLTIISGRGKQKIKSK